MGAVNIYINLVIISTILNTDPIIPAIIAAMNAPDCKGLF